MSSIGNSELSTSAKKWILGLVATGIALLIIAIIVATEGQVSETPATRIASYRVRKVRREFRLMNDLEIMDVMTAGLAELQARKEVNVPTSNADQSRCQEEGIEYIEVLKEGDMEKDTECSSSDEECPWLQVKQKYGCGKHDTSHTFDSQPLLRPAHFAE